MLEERIRWGFGVWPRSTVCDDSAQDEQAVLSVVSPPGHFRRLEEGCVP